MTRQWTLPLAAATVSVLVGSAAAEFPDGPGKEILEKQCRTCHSAEMVLTQRKSVDEWKELVGAMIDQGAEIDDEQVPVLVEYLAKNWGKPDEKSAR